MTNFILEKSVMRRIYLIWVGRLILNRYTIKMALLAFCAWEFAAYVFVRAVMENAAHATGMGYPGYFVTAFFHTHLITQLLVLGIAVLGFWLASDALKNFRYGSFLFRRIV